MPRITRETQDRQKEPGRRQGEVQESQEIQEEFRKRLGDAQDAGKTRETGGVRKQQFLTTRGSSCIVAMDSQEARGILRTAWRAGECPADA